MVTKRSQSTVDEETKTLAAIGPVSSVSCFRGGDIQVTPRERARIVLEDFRLDVFQSSFPLPPALKYSLVHWVPFSGHALSLCNSNSFENGRRTFTQTLGSRFQPFFSPFK